MSLLKYIHKNLSNTELKYDGDYIDPDSSIMKNFQLSSLDYFTFLNGKEQKRYKLNFVGIIINQIKNKILISLPKKFISHDAFRKDPMLYIKTMLEIIFHYTKTKDYLYNNNGAVMTDYPFEPFSNIYHYYYYYGIFKAHYNNVTDKGHKHFLWNLIIKKSHKLIDNNNLIFHPLYSRSKQRNYNFISMCMIYAINHTINIWHGILPGLPRQINIPTHIQNLSTRFIINKLHHYELHTFNDNNRFLIINLIYFFKHKTFKQSYSLKCYDYWFLWENMMMNYLTYHFNGIKSIGHKKQIVLRFTDNITINKFSKPKFYYNILDTTKSSRLNFQPDHYLRSSKSFNTYIFDSKYYKNGIDKTDYKQLVYELLLANKNAHRNIINILFIPSKGSNKGHTKNMVARPYFILNPSFNPTINTPSIRQQVSIYVCKMNSIQVANSYIHKDD